MEFETWLTSIAAKVEKKLEHLIPQQDVPYQQLLSAAKYSLSSGGKRLRPLLALATAEALGSSIENALTPACCLELIHTYSLIHDDLPCMDDDDFRRGKPSLHKAFSEGHAVLTGDFLLTYSFELLSKDQHLSDLQKISLIQILSTKSGAQGMIGGQIMDIESENQEVDLQLLQKMHQYKTGALITAAIEFGSIIGNAPNSTHQQLVKFGEKIGLAFQIVDDILDASENKKNTYTSLLGIEKSKQLADSLLSSSHKIIDGLQIDAKHLKLLADRLVNRKK